MFLVFHCATRTFESDGAFLRLYTDQTYWEEYWHYQGILPEQYVYGAKVNMLEFVVCRL